MAKSFHSIPPSQRRILVIGAGPLGLMALKALREDGFDAHGVEVRSYVGGLWRPEKGGTGRISVAESTVFNTSRFRSAISDFPLPEDASDFPDWREVADYLEGYAKNFGLLEHIRLDTKVKNVGWRGRDQGGWEVTIERKEGKIQEMWDGVVIAIGTFNKPRMPQIKGIDKFEGRLLHSLDFNGQDFAGEKILQIGIHHTASDIAVVLQKQGADKVWMSHRQGVLMLSRYGENLQTYDQVQTWTFVRIQTFLHTYCPGFCDWFFDTVLNKISKKTFPDIPDSWGFSPAPTIAITPPVIADALYPLLKSGFVTPVTTIAEVIGPNSIKLKNGEILEGVDSIICCTGYDSDFGGFMEDSVNSYRIPNQYPTLYRGVFSIHEDPGVRESFAAVGHGAIAFPGFVQHEMLGMAISQTFLGNSKLPDLPEMERWYANHVAWRKQTEKKARPGTTFYPFFQPFGAHWMWLDRMAGTGMFENTGWTFKGWWNWFFDGKFLKMVTSDTMSAASFRLWETGKRKTWAGARQQVVKDCELATKIWEERKAAKLKSA